MAFNFYDGRGRTLRIDGPEGKIIAFGVALTLMAFAVRIIIW